MGDYKKQDVVIEKGILSDISTIEGIGPVGTKQLYSRNIKTVQDLKNAIENLNMHSSEDAQKLLRFKSSLDSFMKSLDSCFDWNRLQNIPQYVLELDDYY